MNRRQAPLGDMLLQQPMDNLSNLWTYEKVQHRNRGPGIMSRPFESIHGHIAVLYAQLRRTLRIRPPPHTGDHQGPVFSVPSNNGFVAVVVVAAFVSFISLCLPSAVGAGDVGEMTPGWLAWKYPNPRTQPGACGWTDVVEWAGDITRNISWLCDPDHVLGYNEAYNLALLLDRYHKEAPCECNLHCLHEGYQIAIALVDRINTDGEFEPMKVKAKNFAQHVRESWFVDQGCDDNVLIFYSFYDDELYISLGEMAEGIISDIELVHLNHFGDNHLTGEAPVTPSPKFNMNQENKAAVNDTVTIVPTTTDIGKRRTSTYGGLESLASEIHVAIMNGPSVSSQLIFAAVIPVLLTLLILIMCLLANWCCRPVYGYDVPAIQDKNDKEDEDDSDEA